MLLVASERAKYIWNAAESHQSWKLQGPVQRVCGIDAELWPADRTGTNGTPEQKDILQERQSADLLIEENRLKKKKKKSSEENHFP